MSLKPATDTARAVKAASQRAYRHSPIVTVARARGGAVAAGDHAPFVADPAVRKQIDTARATGRTGHLVLSIAPGRRPAAPAHHEGGTIQLLVVPSPAPVPGYDAVIADPGGSLASRYGLQRGAGSPSARTATSASSPPLMTTAGTTSRAWPSNVSR